MQKISILVIIIMMVTSFAFAQIAPVAEDISPLLIGETIPVGQLVDEKNQTIKVSTLVATKPTVMIFYRGGWCPYCNVHLSELAKIEKDIIDLGFQLVAVSPESFENIGTTTENDSLHYQVLSDPKGQFIQDMGLAFQASERSLGYITKKSKGEISQVLPVPAVVVVDQKGKILFEYINPTYSARMDGNLLLAVLKTLAKE